VSEYSYGSLFGPPVSGGVDWLVPGVEGVDVPWPDDFAEQIFAGRGEHAHMTVVCGSLDGPRASMIFGSLDWLAGGSSAEVSFLDDDGFDVLSYMFKHVDAHDDFFVDGGVRREQCMFLRSIVRTRYSGERDRYGSKVKKEVLTRSFRTDGMTRVTVGLADREVLGPDWVDPRFDFRVDDEIDVSGDGFWEPVATFGDWDRWFVQDRPGIKLFD